jgi:hypothetical protein
MSHTRSLLIASVLLSTFAVTGQAQQHKGAAHAGGQAPHPGAMHPGQGQRPGMMSPQEQMMHDWIQMQMMAPSRPYTGPRTSKSASSHAGSPNASPSGKGGNRSVQQAQGSGMKSASPGAAQERNGTSGNYEKQNSAKKAKDKEAMSLTLLCGSAEHTRSRDVVEPEPRDHG